MNVSSRGEIIGTLLAATLTACAPIDHNLQDTGDTVSAACTVKPTGFWGLNAAFNDDALITNELRKVAAATGMASFIVSEDPGYGVNTVLPAVEAADLTVAFRMSGANSALIDEDGNFSLERWESLTNTWVGSGVENYVEDGTLSGAMLLDDITNFESDYGGTNPTGVELATMATYSKSLFPELTTFIRRDADGMPEADYADLDAVLSQYSTKTNPDVSDYIDSNLTAAKNLGVQTIWGLNIVDGGDGSSGQIGSRSDLFLMTPDEIKMYGEAELLAEPNSLGLYMWEYDGNQELADGSNSADHFMTPEYQAAFASLADLAVCEN